MLLPSVKKFLFIIILNSLLYADDAGSTFLHQLIYIYETPGTASSNNISWISSFLTKLQVMKYFFLTKWYDVHDNVTHIEGALSWPEEVMIFLNPVFWNQFDIQKKSRQTLRVRIRILLPVNAEYISYLIQLNVGKLSAVAYCTVILCIHVQKTWGIMHNDTRILAEKRKCIVQVRHGYFDRHVVMSADVTKYRSISNGKQNYLYYKESASNWSLTSIFVTYNNSVPTSQRTHSINREGYSVNAVEDRN